MNQINLVQRNIPNTHFLWRWQTPDATFKEALQVVFGHLPYLTLRNCAIVSKSWRKMALNELHNRCTITINENRHAQYVIHKLETTPNFRVGKCIIASPYLDETLVKQLLLSMPITITINVLHLDSSVISKDALFLINIIASLSNLTHLSVVSGVNQNARKSPEHLNSWITPFSSGPTSSSSSSQKNDINDNNIVNECSSTSIYNYTEKRFFVHKNLRYLHFDTGKDAQLQLSKILHAFPSLIELSVANLVDEPRKHFKCEHTSGLLSLQSFTLRQYSNISFPEKLVHMLLKLNVCLENLMLIFHPPTQSLTKALPTTSALLRQFIESQQASLKSLKLIQVEDDVCSSINSYCSKLDKNGATATKTTQEVFQQNICIPNVSVSSKGTDSRWSFNYAFPSISLFPVTLPNLEVLHVQKPLITNLALVLKHFPRLRQLSIQVSPNGSNWKGMLPQKLESHTEVKEFKLDFIDLESFTRLGNFFPCLETLKLAYCDVRLINVLCKQIPSFNVGAAKNKLTVCVECHEGQEVNGDQIGECSSSGHFPEVFLKSGNSGRSFSLFKNLKLLKVRPCHHYPYENFVFLQTTTNTGQSINVSDMKNTNEDDSFDSIVGFSWKNAGILKEQDFVDLPLFESTDTCSSA